MTWKAKCSPCGAPGQGQTHHWMYELRVLYVINRAWSSPKFSGVGLHVQGSLRIPPAYEQRYGDPDHDVSSDMIVDSIQWHGQTLMIPDDFVNTREALFHDACWKILVEASRPYQVDIDVLHCFFLSFPIQDDCVDWGHDYAGYDPDIYRADLFHGLELSSLLDISIRKREDFRALQHGLVNLCAKSAAKNDQSESYFSKWPVEIRESILILLPSKDIWNLCTTIRAFAELKLSETFWASRFSAGFEHDCMFEARNPIFGDRYLSARHLHMGLLSLSKSPEIRNRKRG